MKFTLNIKHLAVVVIIAAGIICYLKYALVPGTINDNTTYIIENTSKPLDPEIPTDLPYNKYIALKQKAQQVRDIKNGDWYNGNSLRFGYIIATNEALFCDTCTVGNSKLEISGKQQYYIALPGWRLKQDVDSPWHPDSTTLYVDKGQSYIRKTVVDKFEKAGHNLNYTTHFAAIPVKFKYHREGNYVMIPVAKGIKQVCDYILYGMFILFLGFFFFIIGEFLKFVFALSKGQAFTVDNVFRLRIIALGLLGYPVVMFLLALLMRLIFSSYLTSDITLNPAVYSDSWQMVCAGIVFWLLFKAFKQGKALKEENELTV